MDLRWPESGSGSDQGDITILVHLSSRRRRRVGRYGTDAKRLCVGLLCNPEQCIRLGSGLVISCLKTSAKGSVAAFGVRGECFGREDIARLRLGHMASLRNWLCEPDGAMHAGLGARGGCGSDKEAKQKSEAME